MVLGDVTVAGEEPCAGHSASGVVRLHVGPLVLQPDALRVLQVHAVEREFAPRVQQQLSKWLLVARRWLGREPREAAGLKFREKPRVRIRAEFLLNVLAERRPVAGVRREGTRVVRVRVGQGVDVDAERLEEVAHDRGG